MNSRRAGQRPPILSDHRRVRTRFVPPLLSRFNVETSSWVDERVPEILWLALLNEDYGWTIGAELALQLARAAGSVAAGRETVPLFVAASDYASLSPEEWKEVATALGNDWHKIRDGLLPVIERYPRFPMFGIMANGSGLPESPIVPVAKIRRVVESMQDRSGLAAMRAQANAVYIAFATDRLSATPDTALADFPEVERYPESERSKEVAAAIRVTLITLLTGLSSMPPSSWPAEFWRCGLEIGDCE